MEKIVKEVLSKINMQETLKAVTDKGLEKLTASVFGALLFDFAYVMGIFCILAIVDIISKCCSLSCEWWNRCYGAEFTKKYGNLVSFLRDIPRAYEWRIINSNAMVQIAINKVLDADMPCFNKRRFEKKVEYAMALKETKKIDIL